MRSAIRKSYADVNQIIQGVTRCEHGDIYSSAKQSLLEYDQCGLSDAPLTFVPVNCMASVVDDKNSEFTKQSLVATINVQRGFLVGILMDRIQKHILNTSVDRIAGRYYVGLCLRRLLEACPTLIVPAIADMMVRNDTSSSLSALFQRESAQPSHPLSAKIDELNVEIMLILENWVTNGTRASRAIPFPNGDKALEDFDTPWRGSPGSVVYTSPQQLSLTQEEQQRDPADSVWVRLLAATDKVRHAYERHRDSSVGVHSLHAEGVSSWDVMDSRLSTLHLSAQDPNLSRFIGTPDTKASVAHYVATVNQTRQEGRLYFEAKERGLSEVTQGITGCDRPVAGVD
jgi:hypothetical protein